MIEHVFPPEMMYEREKQLITALLDCAGVCYDINFTQNRILGNPIQVVDGKEYEILPLIGKEKNCTYTEIIEYWSEKMPKEEVASFKEFSDIENVLRRFENGERILKHKFWTYDVLGNPMLAQQKMVIYKDLTNGDVLGITYVSNGSEIESARQKEAQLDLRYKEASHRAEVMQSARESLPGGYHRCAKKEGFPFLFVSKSFEQIVGYSKEQLEKELDNTFANLVAPEDRRSFDGFLRRIETEGYAELTYRIRRRDGEIRWVQHSSMAIDYDGVPCLQCTVADITDFIKGQEELARENSEYEHLAESVPCGYHRCTTDGGFLLSFVSDSFLDTVGYTKEEVLYTPFIDLVAPEDKNFFLSHEPELTANGKVDLVYRVVRKDGSHRWIKDSTMRVKSKGKDYYQCILADITEFVTRQENMLKKNMELSQSNFMFNTIEKNMPGGYHRCAAADGFPFTFIGDHFLQIVGFTKEEIKTDFGNLYRNLMWDEDKDKISTAQQIEELKGHGNAYDTRVYRLKHKDGGYRWVTDSTMFVDMGEDSFFQAVVSDITEFVEEINTAKKEAEASNLAKSTFLFNASHDIRTPMNAIKGFAHIIKNNTYDPHIVSETVRKIETAGDTLMTLMNDILDLARIERGKEEVVLAPANIYESGKNLYEMFYSEMAAAGIDFYASGDKSKDTVLCDNLKVTRIVMNMLSNAKKFTPPGGSVTFGSDKLSDDGKYATYRFFVKDTGIGMSDAFQKRAFEQFERERTSTESGVTGSGLGMAIIKRLVDLMGGTVEIKSELGVGTEISATLTFEKVVGEYEKETGEKKPAADLSGKRVLLVEDNEFNREIAKYMLEGLGLKVDQAENGSVCLDMVMSADAGYYKLILMDLQMPVLNGYDAAKTLGKIKDKGICDIPIVAMTANAFDEDKQKCLAAGMVGHIAKPIETEALVKTLSGILSAEGSD